jgi:hypothetical protein
LNGSYREKQIEELYATAGDSGSRESTEIASPIANNSLPKQWRSPESDSSPKADEVVRRGWRIQHRALREI